MDNQKPVLQIRPYSSNGHYAAIVICVAIILVSAFCQAFHYFYATLFVFAFLLLVLFIHFNDIKKARTINFINYYKVDYYFCASMILISIALCSTSLALALDNLFSLTNFKTPDNILLVIPKSFKLQSSLFIEPIIIVVM